MTDAREPRVDQEQTTFRRSCAVALAIRAPAARIWSLLTNAADMPRWNSTVTKIDGEIGHGNRLAVRVPISERTFSPKVTRFEAPSLMVWSDGMAPMFKGERTFTLRERGDGTTEFSMVEVFTGWMLPLIGKSLPDFGPPFEQYARDLQREAEKGAG